MKKLYTLMLITLLAPFLLANQTIDVDVPYVMSFVDNSGYDLDTGAVISDNDFARTDKKINRNSIIYVNDYELFTYVLFYDNLDQYIGYYTTTNSSLYGTEWITGISSNEFSPPSNAYYFAYMIDKNSSFSKNLLRNDIWEQGTYNTTTGVLLPSTTRVRGIFEIQPDTTYVRTDGTLYFRSQGFYDENMTFIGVQNTISGSSFTTPLNAKFVILVYSLTSLGTETITPQDVVDGQPQLELGTVPTTYEPYYKINGVPYNTFNNLTNTYRQTFYDPLPSNSIALIVSGILAIGLMLLGFITRARIFNLFSIAPFIVIAIMLPEPAIIIAMIGMIIWQLYYTFRMD